MEAKVTIEVWHERGAHGRRIYQAFASLNEPDPDGRRRRSGHNYGEGQSRCIRVAVGKALRDLADIIERNERG